MERSLLPHDPAVYGLPSNIRQSADQQPLVQTRIVEYAKGSFTFKLPTLNANKQPEHIRIIDELLCSYSCPGNCSSHPECGYRAEDNRRSGPASP